MFGKRLKVRSYLTSFSNARSCSWITKRLRGPPASKHNVTTPKYDSLCTHDAEKTRVSSHTPDGIAAPSGAFAISHDRCLHAFGHVICADADALQAWPPFNGR